MIALTISLAFFVASWLVHFAWWRWRLPRLHTRALVICFASVPAVATAVLIGSNLGRDVDVVDWAAIALFHVAASCCYFITYAGVEATSPSLTLVRSLEKAGPRGATPLELQDCITDDDFLLPRLDALLRDSLVVLEGDTYRLTARGRSAARVSGAIAMAFNLGAGA